MKAVRLLTVLLHLAAIFATAGIPLCTGADGHIAYELGMDECCGDPDASGACADCPGSCEGPGEVPAIHHDSDCGACTDEIAPLPSGVRLVAAAVAPAPSATTLQDSRRLASAPAAAPAPDLAAPGRFVVLRC